MNRLSDDQIREKHLNNFKYAVRGRRGVNPPPIENENEWWALGQHHGLATPLLDWTTSPFVAAYFAFLDEKANGSDKRAIYAVSPITINKVSLEIKTNYSGVGRPPIIEFIKPFSDENPRLVNQGGLFTRSPDGVDLETWIKKHLKGVDISILMKFILPNTERETCLRTLNRMNINHLTLFPDLYGASKYCNINLEISKY